jgi:Rod binding domain-containing protein
MSSIEQSAAASFQFPVTLPPRGFDLMQSGSGLSTSSTRLSSPKSAELTTRLAGDKDQTAELREKFTQFVGEAFFGQMIKAMRSTVGKPAYFYGGRGEAAFQGQLDQKMAEELAKKSASRFAEPMFERQFPKLAEPKAPHDLNQLAALRRQ